MNGKISFTATGWEDYLYWQSHDKKTIRRINELLKDIVRNGPTNGIGRPEVLLGDLSGCYSRHINEKDRLVYAISAAGDIEVWQCHGHYSDK